MNGTIVLVDFICLVMFVDAVRGSSRRLLSLAYAVSGALLVAALAGFAVLMLAPHSGGSAATNRVLGVIGLAVTIAAPIAAVYGAFRPARRVKA
jgi:hypothetical protein